MIVGAEIVAGHDGAAELLVRLRHANGVVSPVVLDEEAGLALMDNCGASHVADLAGLPWRRIIQRDEGRQDDGE